MKNFALFCLVILVSIVRNECVEEDGPSEIHKVAINGRDDNGHQTSNRADEQEDSSEDPHAEGRHEIEISPTGKPIPTKGIIMMEPLTGDDFKIGSTKKPPEKSFLTRWIGKISEHFFSYRSVRSRFQGRLGEERMADDLRLIQKHIFETLTDCTILYQHNCPKMLRFQEKNSTQSKNREMASRIKTAIKKHCTGTRNLLKGKQIFEESIEFKAGMVHLLISAMDACYTIIHGYCTFLNPLQNLDENRLQELNLHKLSNFYAKKCANS